MACGDYEIIREGEDIIAKVNCEECLFFPSLEDEPKLMGITVNILIEAGTITKLVFFQKREVEYDYEQVVLLSEIAEVFKQVSKSLIRIFSADPESQKWMFSRFSKIQDLIKNTLKTDPVFCYVELKRLLREEKIKVSEGITPEPALRYLEDYFSFIDKTIQILEKTKLIKLAEPHIPGLKAGDRKAYREIFFPSIKPDFIFTKIMSAYPSEGKEIASYQIGNTEITIFEMPNTVQYLYHMIPAEFKLSEEKYELVDTARKILAEHKPRKTEFTDPERMRQVFTAVSLDLLEELSESKGISLRNKEKKELAQIIVRHTVGFGLIELLLDDENIQDVVVNSPMGRGPVFLVHGEFGDCITNIIPTVPEGESWASKLRMISGRPLDEANPVLDTELLLPNARARVAAISNPLNPTGIAFAFRRHREKPWTIPLLIDNKMLSPLAGGVLSFIIDGSRTILVAGTRSAGKTSILGSIMVDIMRRSRILTIEDTLELPVNSLRKLNYNIQSMKVASALTRGTTEVSAEEGIRTTLRLGDSALIIGEVRSKEAKALYEAMRVGALANVVAGTIHGDSPYGVFDRVVNDLEVPKTSFKATDIIIVANQIRSPDGIHKRRRVTQITEVRKRWEQDPLLEEGFIDLFKYDPEEDSLVPTDELLRGDSEIIKNIAGTVKEWAGNWDAVWENIELRTKIKQALIDACKKLKKSEILEADFYVLANDAFHKVCDKVKKDKGVLDSKRVFFEWNEWFKKALKK